MIAPHSLGGEGCPSTVIHPACNLLYRWHMFPSPQASYALSPIPVC